MRYKIAAAKRLLALGYLDREHVEEWIDEDPIGGGMYASVYALGDRFVVKLTDDERDARTAEHVRRLQDTGGGTNLVRVHYVCSLDSCGKYMIVNERVDKLPDELFRHASYSAMSYRLGTPNIIAGAKLRASGVYQTPDWGSLSNNWGVADWGVAAALNIRGIANDLEAAGVTCFDDWHGRNVMWRHEANGSGRVVLVDFGCSISPPVEIAA